MVSLKGKGFLFVDSQGITVSTLPYSVPLVWFSKRGEPKYKRECLNSVR